MPSLQKCAIAVASICLALFSEPLFAADAAEPELQAVVVVSRHGVRSPTQSTNTLQKWSPREWPQWDVPRGYLTERGFDLVRQTWMAEAKNPVFAHSSCPKPGEVRIVADVDERTRKTAEALSQGLYGGCKIPVEVTDQEESPIFSPLKAGVCSIENISELDDRLSERSRRIGDQYGAALEKISRITRTSLNAAVAAEVYPRKVKLIGPLYKASSIAEIFSLEWAEFPNRLPGWGEVTEKVLEEELMPMRVAVFSALNRDPQVALYKGSSLANAVLEALNGTVKYTYFVGHDTNLANLGALFSLNWKLPGRAVNENTPGGYLVFEKWKVRGRVQIHIFYSALSPSQMRATEIVGKVPRVEIPVTTHNYEMWSRLSKKKLFTRCIPQF